MRIYDSGGTRKGNIVIVDRDEEGNVLDHCSNDFPGRELPDGYRWSYIDGETRLVRDLPNSERRGV